ncbi:hypothetical protein KQX54_004999 [Cotesia glomerata]|uniref:Uncharacterized protein n=1 Tax=Cotesia glomerata TaxID=32391 RepID=A0AAV7HR83_COTGL|nr:hypothetical protein KQX54_004999 [Cotesia glomerata]
MTKSVLWITRLIGEEQPAGGSRMEAIRTFDTVRKGKLAGNCVIENCRAKLREKEQNDAACSYSMVLAVVVVVLFPFIPFTSSFYVRVRPMAVLTVNSEVVCRSRVGASTVRECLLQAQLGANQYASLCLVIYFTPSI